jgi:hypothetical protein
MPDRNAPPREGGFSDQAPGGGLGPEQSFNESKIEAREEQVDQRFLGEGSNLEKNDEEAQARTSLEDVTLAKPRSSTQKGEQPIPLEYRDVLK